MQTIKLNSYNIDYYNDNEYYSLYHGIENELEIIYNENKDSYYVPIYLGLCKNISEELANKIVDYEYYGYNEQLEPMKFGYKNYKPKDFFDKFTMYPFKTAQESFQTLSNLKYCVIIKLQTL